MAKLTEMREVRGNAGKIELFLNPWWRKAPAREKSEQSRGVILDRIADSFKALTKFSIDEEQDGATDESRRAIVTSFSVDVSGIKVSILLSEGSEARDLRKLADAVEHICGFGKESSDE